VTRCRTLSDCANGAAVGSELCGRRPVNAESTKRMRKAAAAVDEHNSQGVWPCTYQQMEFLFASYSHDVNRGRPANRL
jgi:hypothetical protein